MSARGTLGFGLWTALLLSAAACAAPPFEVPRPGRAFAFPRDHGAHPGFATEWWYVTGHLRPVPSNGGPDADLSGFQLTFFRASAAASPLATAPGRWAVPDLYLAHFALVDAGRFAHAERLARPGPGWAAPDDLDVGTDGWTLRRLRDRTPETWALAAADQGGALALELTPAKAPAVHGEDGVHRKGDCPACASHYVSVTRLDARGTLTRGGVTQEVEGAAWFDHEFMSGGLDRGQAGWDWLGLHLSDGSDLMVARIRGDRPRIDGTLVDPARPGPTRLKLGSVTLAARETWISPLTGGRYPVRQVLDVPGEELHLELAPLRDDQELLTRGTGVNYWEGLMRVTGTRRGKPISGLGYLEMTGYAGATPLTPGGPGGGR